MRRGLKSLVSCHFRRSYLKANKVSKSEGTNIISESVLMLFTKNYQNQSVLVETTVSQKWLVFIARY